MNFKEEDKMLEEGLEDWREKNICNICGHSEKCIKVCRECLKRR